MKKLVGSLLTAVSLICIVLLAYILLAGSSMGIALQMAVLPIVGALVTAYAAGKLFAADDAVQPVPSEA